MYCNWKGGLVVIIFGKDIDYYCMLMVYVDILGVMVKEIKLSGCLKIDLIGGFCYNFIEGEYCEIEILLGEVFIGIIFMY